MSHTQRAADSLSCAGVTGLRSPIRKRLRADVRANLATMDAVDRLALRVAGSRTLLAVAQCLAALACLGATGCVSDITRISSACDAVPAFRLPNELLAPSRNGKVPIDFTLLRQQPPPVYFISPGDTLAVYIQGVAPTSNNETAPLYTNINGTRDAYPATGLIHAPFVGLPLVVDQQGAMELPLVGRLNLAGLTLDQAREVLRRAYTVDQKILQPGRDRIVLSMIKPRVHRVLVIREDVNSSLSPTYFAPVTTPYTKRGTAEVLDLPEYENDVLHAIISSGGLPGIDARNAVWILRSRVAQPTDIQPALAQVNGGGDPRQVLQSAKVVRNVLQIPLRVCPGEMLPFGEQDILLHDGDIVYLESRDDEVFYTGGLLPGCRFPLPRDRDLDVIAAIAMTTASAGGPAGTNGASMNFRSIGPGGIINPTRVIVVRQLPSGEQLKIRVDLNRAVVDSRERILIQSGDFVMLEFKPWEYMGNFVLSLARTSITYIPQ